MKLQLNVNIQKFRKEILFLNMLLKWVNTFKNNKIYNTIVNKIFIIFLYVNKIINKKNGHLTNFTIQFGIKKIQGNVFNT